MNASSDGPSDGPTDQSGGSNPSPVGVQGSIAEIQCGDEEKVLLQTSRFRVVETLFTGLGGQTQRREVVRHPGAVTVIPMVDDNHVCLIQNTRPAVGETLIELPAGTLEEGENPRHAAARELTEETGYQAANLQSLHAFYLSPGILDEKMHLYVAAGLTEGPPNREPTESITNLVLAWTDAMALVFDQQIHDAKTLIGLLYYDQLRGRR